MKWKIFACRWVRLDTGSKLTTHVTAVLQSEARGLARAQAVDMPGWSLVRVAPTKMEVVRKWCVACECWHEVNKGCPSPEVAS